MRIPRPIIAALAALALVVGGSAVVSVAATPTSSHVFADSVVPKNVTDPDTSAVELGVKFSSNKDISLTGIRFYQGPKNVGPHAGHVWSSTGKVLATVQFPNTTTVGWQTATLATPLAVKAGTTYTASYISPKGRYSGDTNYFTKAVTDGTVTFPKNAGVYNYTVNKYPTTVYQATNYYVDVLYTSSTVTTPPVTTPPVVTPTPTPTPTETATPTPTPTPTPPAQTGFPNASNTGYLGSSSDLTTKAIGNVTVAGTVIDHVHVTGGSLYVNAPNVVISNSVIDGGFWGLETGPNSSGLIVRDTTFLGGAGAAILDTDGGDNIQYLRLNITGSVDGIKLGGNGRLLQDSYIDKLANDGQTTHNDGIQASDGSNWRILHNYIHTTDTGDISMFEGQGTWNTILIGGNRLEGGGYPIYAGGSSAKNVTIKDNVIGPWGYGPWTDEGAAIFSGNTDQNGKSIG